MQEWLRARAAQRGEQVWVPSSFEDTDEAAEERARGKLGQAQEGLQRARESKAMDLWREDLARVMPLLMREWDAPLWVSSAQRPQRRGR